MKSISLFVALIGLSSVAANTYTSRFDDVDVDRILQNRRILTNYIKCLLGEGSCTSEGRELKRTLPGALVSDCSKCNEKQKRIAEKVIDFLIKNRPNDWSKLLAKYDPQGYYEKRYRDNVSKLNA